jgi:ABC-2 type transport system ATP-binding protein
MISIQNLSKKFADTVALENINLEVKKGELFGLIGPDGAGKTTLFRILTTLLLPDSGSASVGGFDILRDFRAIRGSVGYMPGRFSLYQDLSVQENLEFFATVFGTTIEANYDQIKPIYSQIEPFRDRRAGQLSGGMKQKLALSCALVHRPDVLLLDEPTTGVDPVSRAEFWDMLDLLKKDGLTMLVSTPYMDEASRCDRIALMQKGLLLDMDTPAKIIAKNRRPMLGLRGQNMFRLLEFVRAWEGSEVCYGFGDSHHLTLKNGFNQKKLEDYLSKTEFSQTKIFDIQPDIEDIFMQLLNESEK